MIGVGAAFDFLAGASPSPPLLQRLGARVALPLATEPRRLWRGISARTRASWRCSTGSCSSNRISGLRGRKSLDRRHHESDAHSSPEQAVSSGITW